MTLVVGGAYQGKLDYVLGNYPVSTVFQCDINSANIDLSADVINSLHLAVLAQTRMWMDPLAILNGLLPMLKDKVIICDDISCGVVPIERENRLWREATGHCLAMLSKYADEVIRVFCGIGSRIK